MPGKKHIKLVGRIIILNILILSSVFLCTTFCGVIITEQDWFIYKKQQLTLEDTIIDTRSWKVMDYADNPHITELLLRRGYNKVIDDMKL